ncbi:MAG: RNase adapter RapZ [Rhodobacteraceae bacterium]|jgi:UPF0042 nucleotide-binding protein|nr:RNase adapter RapZ [Paracoccaceae bacterium]
MNDIAVGQEPAINLVLVTGLSGAGRTTAIRALEDIGYETIDNLPISLLPNIVSSPSKPARIAVGLDTRNRDFSTHGVLEMLETLSRMPWLKVDLVFIQCSTEVLVRRFSETRRRHPLAPAESPIIGIERERDLLLPILVRADVLLNSSDMSPHEMRGEITSYYSTDSALGLAVSVQSFSYKRGLPRGVDMLFDCRFLRNPYWDANLRSLDGQNKSVQDYVKQDTNFNEFYQKIRDLCLFLLPAYKDEGKTHFSIGFGCTGGKHRSVTLTELLANDLAHHGWQVSIRHREKERLSA